MESNTKARKRPNDVDPNTDEEQSSEVQAASAIAADPAPLDPWDEQDARAVKEAEGALFKWRHGWTLTLRRISGWNKHWADATAKLSRRPDIKAFISRTSAKDYVYTEADRAFWKTVETRQFAEGCIANWHVTGRGGELLAMTPKNIMDVMTKFPDFLSEARTFAATEENYAPDIIVDDDALGNS